MLVQFAPPAELLAHPVNDFVADFVGADRALKSLSLTRLEEIDLLEAPLVRAGEPVVDVQARIERGELEPIGGQVLVSDVAGRPLGWLPVSALGDAEAVPDHRDRAPEPVLDQVDHPPRRPVGPVRGERRLRRCSGRERRVRGAARASR